MAVALFFMGKNTMQKLILSIALLTFSYITNSYADNSVSATAADVDIQTGTEDAVSIQSEHQGEIRAEINGEAVDPANHSSDEMDEDKTAKDDFF